jgi:hypothetical protein
MPDGIRWVGLDVHARESTVAVFDQATGEVTTKRVVGRPHELLPYLRAVERPARMVYEAGPSGYGLARRATQRRGERPAPKIVACIGAVNFSAAAARLPRPVARRR